MKNSHILTFVSFAIPVALSAAFMMTNCQGDWFDNPELATCDLFCTLIAPDSVTFLYFMGPLTLVVLAVVYVVRILSRTR